MVRGRHESRLGQGLAFDLPDRLAAREPPERRGLNRDGVRLLAADRLTGALRHARFRDLPAFLRPGDCLVFNASRTMPASLGARLREAHGEPLEVRLARRVEAFLWSALLLDTSENPREGCLEGTLDFGADLSARIVGRDPLNPRLRHIRFSLAGAGDHGDSGPGGPGAFPGGTAALMAALSRLGKPIRYWYASRPWNLDWYQTVFAREPGSMEMPSAGRAFTWRLLLDLRCRGVGTAFLVLHAGLSSYMDREYDASHPMSVEPYRIGPEAAAAVNAAKAAGGRVVAVGTTAVRALESAVTPDGRVEAREGHTALRITGDYRLRAVDGLLTGFHEPEASHLDLLSAFLPENRLRAVYEEALGHGYLWHEFGDINLIL